MRSNVLTRACILSCPTGFTLDGTVKLLDFGLAKVVDDATVDSDEVYMMSGETGSLRYMAPEVADGLPYNHTADVYSFGIILWELNASKKPYEGLNRELFYERIVHGGERPPIGRKWPIELSSLMSECWDADMFNRPKFRDIVKRLDALLMKEKGGGSKSSHNPSSTITGGNGKPGTGTTPADGKESKTIKFLPKFTGMIDRHSTWF
jgi:serine/threonine protein kinase